MQPTTREHLRAILRSAAAASLGTALVLALRGRAEHGRAAAPLNAVSHIVFGDEALRRNAYSRKYTVTGFLLNTAAVTGWAAVHELLFRRRRPLWSGPLVSGLAYAVDYWLVPRRLTPGFEHRLSKRSLAGVYAALAVTLALAARR